MTKRERKSETERSELENLRAEISFFKRKSAEPRLEAAFLKNLTKSKAGGSKTDTK